MSVQSIVWFDLEKAKSAQQLFGKPESSYLEFDTPIPTPVRPLFGQLPPKPNLNKYTDPQRWSTAQKQSLIWQSVIGTVLTAYAAGTYAPAAEQMEAAFHVSRVAVLVGVTVFTLGFGIAPMVLAPFSELQGRRPVFVIAGVIFVIALICTTVTQIYSGMIVARLVGGLASSVFSTMVGGVVADIYSTKDRNTPMALFAGGVIFGTGLGPMIGGFIAEKMSWRWVFGVHAIITGAFMIIIVFFFRESRASVLLSRRAKLINEWYEACEAAGSPGVVFMDQEHGQKLPTPRRLRWKTKADEDRPSLGQMIKISMFRPFVLLFTEPTVLFFSLWITFAWSILYLQFSTIPYIFETVYDFGLGESNAVFAAVMIVSLIMTVVSIYQEKVLLYYRPDAGKNPESRLWPAAIASVFLPIGLFWVGWSSRASVPWIVPALGTGVSTIGIFSIYLATFNYLADSYLTFASSAIAGQSFCRNIIGGAFPLFAEQFYHNVGIGPSSSILGAAGLVLCAVPFVLAVLGPRIRDKSKFAMSQSEQ